MALYGIEAKYDSYIYRVFQSICDYYHYNLIKGCKKEDILELKDSKDTKKLYFVESLKNNNFLGVASINYQNTIMLTEVISLAYRFLEELGLPNLMVKIYFDDKKVFDYLNYLDVDYEICPKNEYASFEILSDKTILAKGTNKDGLSICLIDTKELIENLKKLDNLKDEKGIDIYVTAESMEEKLTAVRLVQDLRWSEIITELNYKDEPLEEQLKEANHLHARIIILLHNEDLQKGLLTVKDNLTGEEKKVDENEILDYIMSIL